MLSFASFFPISKCGSPPNLTPHLLSIHSSLSDSGNVVLKSKITTFILVSAQIIAPTLTSFLSYILKIPTFYSPSPFEVLQAISNLTCPLQSSPTLLPTTPSKFSLLQHSPGDKAKKQGIILSPFLFLVPLIQSINKFYLLYLSWASEFSATKEEYWNLLYRLAMEF